MRITRIGNIYVESDGESIELMIVDKGRALRSMKLYESDSLKLLSELITVCRQMLPDIREKLELEASKALKNSDEFMAEYNDTKNEKYREKAEMYAAIAKRFSEAASIAEKLMKLLDEARPMVNELASKIW